MTNPGTYNIIAYQGATFDVTATYSIGGTAIDLDGYTAAMQIRESFDSTDPIISLTNGSGITLGGTAGTININISASTMGSAEAGQYVYDLELTSGAVVTRLLQGTFEIEPEVTK